MKTVNTFSVILFVDLVEIPHKESSFFRFKLTTLS